MCPVAPPRGERGLKLKLGGYSGQSGFVAPPRGERGLKHPLECDAFVRKAPSLPLVGSVD